MGRQPCCEKVGLKRGPWTVDEDNRLMNFILHNGIHCWRRVPKLAGDDSVRVHICPHMYISSSYTIIGNLLIYVHLNDRNITDLYCNFWELVMEGLLRCGKSCRLRWINYLRPDLKRGDFTVMEEDQIIQLHSQLGNRYAPMRIRRSFFCLIGSVRKKRTMTNLSPSYAGGPR